MCEGYGSYRHLAVSSAVQFHDNLSEIAKQTGFLAVILSHPDQSFPCKSCSFLNCSLLELYSLSFSLMFEERGLRTSQIFISLPIYIIYQQIIVLSTLQNFMTTVSEIQLAGTMRESQILMRILKTSSFFVGFDRHFCA